jgi:hypothetical protein
MKQGNRASLQAIQRKTEKVEFPEFDTFYLLREMSGTERDRYEIAAVKETYDPKEGNGKATPRRTIDMLYLRARLVALCMVDENNDRIYADDEVQQLADEIPASVIIKLYTAAQHLNGLDVTPEDAAKNSDSDQSEYATSSLPLH